MPCVMRNYDVQTVIYCAWQPQIVNLRDTGRKPKSNPSFYPGFINDRSINGLRFFSYSSNNNTSLRAGFSVGKKEARRTENSEF